MTALPFRKITGIFQPLTSEAVMIAMSFKSASQIAKVHGHGSTSESPLIAAEAGRNT
jgi:hypothetical protein